MAHVVMFCGYGTLSHGTRPAGAYSIANVLRSLGLSTIVIDMVLGLPRSHVEDMIDRYVGEDTKFVCLSTTLLGPAGVTVTFVEQNDEMFRPYFDRCKARAPSAKFLAGGSKLSYGERSNLQFDYQVKGQGEGAIVAIVNHELFGLPLEYTEQDGTRVVTDKVYGVADFNSSQNLVFTEHDGILPNETLVVEFGRGCAFKCSFCSYDLTGKNFGDYTRDAETLYAGLMSNYERWGTTRYIIVDDTINESLDKAKLLLSVSQRLPFKLEFGGYFRIELFHRHPEMARMYLEAGLVGVSFGIETFNKVAGSVVGKGFGERAKDVLCALRKDWGSTVHISSNFILGLPNDTLDDLERQIQWIESNGEVLDNARFTPLTISSSYDSLLSNGKLSDYYVEDTSGDPGAVDPAIYAIYKRKSMMWKSPVMRYVDAITLVDVHTKRLFASRQSLAGVFNVFASMPLARTLSLADQRTTPISKLREVLHENAVSRVAGYTEAMSKVPNPEWPLPITPVRLVQPNTHVFKSKIIVKRA